MEHTFNLHCNCMKLFKIYLIDAITTKTKENKIFDYKIVLKASSQFEKFIAASVNNKVCKIK